MDTGRKISELGWLEEPAFDEKIPVATEGENYYITPEQIRDGLVPIVLSFADVEVGDDMSEVLEKAEKCPVYIEDAGADGSASRTTGTTVKSDGNTHAAEISGDSVSGDTLSHHVISCSDASGGGYLVTGKEVVEYKVLTKEEYDEMQEALETAIRKIREDISSIDRRMRDMDNRIKELDGRVGNVESRLGTLESTVSSLSRSVESLKERLRR